MTRPAPSDRPAPSGPILQISDLEVDYAGSRGVVHAVRGVDLTINAGEIVAIVGESGSGKSTLAHSVIGLLPAGGAVRSGRIRFGSADITGWGPRALQRIRGRQIGLIPQDPAVSLDPVQRIGRQVAETLRIHRIARGREADAQAVQLLRQAGLSDPQARARQYPHQLSGGMRQRVLIAIAIACRPRLIIAYEPTSALDVTVQRQILDQIEELTREAGSAVMLITHDRGDAADQANHIDVMSKGRVVEAGAEAAVLGSP